VKNIIRFLLLGVILIVSGYSNAAGGLGSNVITKMAFQSNHVFIYSAGWNNANTCDRAVAVVLQKNDQNFDKAYALLLAAFMSGKAVSGYSDNCIELDGKTYNTIRGFKYLSVE